MTLVAISPPTFDVAIELAYATPNNVAGRAIYRGDSGAYLHAMAADRLARAIAIAKPLGLRFKVFDAYRPIEAQWALWNADPNPEFLADPSKGGPHNRGVAVDLTLIDAENRELDMGTGFDSFTELSHHGRADVTVAAQRNRLLLMGIMTSAGWDFYRNEWWHYQLFKARDYPIIDQAMLPRPMVL